MLQTSEILLDEEPESANAEFKFEFIDLFAGIGGLRKGFEEIGGKCIYTSEWDKYSQMTYRANNSDDKHEISGDITKESIADIPAHDLLLAGFPCCPSSYKMGHESVLSIGGSGSFV